MSIPLDFTLSYQERPIFKLFIQQSASCRLYTERLFQAWSPIKLSLQAGAFKVRVQACAKRVKRTRNLSCDALHTSRDPANFGT